MYNPVSTYRVQFNCEFIFSDLSNIIPYLKNLGVKTIYASPIFKAVPGSMHGYDVVNPYILNPEIGTEDQFRSLVKELHDNGMGWIQDIVPNHMAFHHDNVWLMDVLEKGSMSVYASFFDITWASDFYNARLMAPFLEAPLEEIINSKKLQIVFERNGLWFRYGDQLYPLNSRTYQAILLFNPDAARENIIQLAKQFDKLHHIPEPVQYALARHELQLQFNSLLQDDDASVYLEDCIQEINNSTKRLKDIADDQYYRLCEWKETIHHINYRRFFLVNGLICLNMQSEDVFNQYHKSIKRFIDDGLFQGLRIDHIDGLFDAGQYINRLRSLCGEDVYIVVEKILEPGELLNRAWPIEGTTGYDFLAFANNLFTNNNAERKLSKFYKELTDQQNSVGQEIISKKRIILLHHMGGELDNLYKFFKEKNFVALTDSDTTYDFKSAIAEFLIHCPIYRMYGSSLPLTDKENKEVRSIFYKCRFDNPKLTHSLNALERCILDKPMEGDKQYNDNMLQFYQRVMQFTGPLAAKGIEDTLMYTFNRFIAHNEVGDSVDNFGLTINEFHEAMLHRQVNWPLTMNTTSTHDTKRGEDVRMRLNVLSDISDEWIQVAKEWMELNKSLKVNDLPHVNTEYFIYQTLIGAFPMNKETDFVERLKLYFTKAFREAKEYTEWNNPDEQYEDAVFAFINNILTSDDFKKSFQMFHYKISDFGILNSLAQLILKFTSPGIPDTYQGTTSWNLSLVDPDNRRPVNFEDRLQALTKIVEHGDETAELINELWRTRTTGDIKLWLTHKLLNLRNEYKDVFAEGFYKPLEIKGKHKDHCMAFARRRGRVWIISVVSLNLASISVYSGDTIYTDWDDTRVEFPDEAPLEWSSFLIHSQGQHKGHIYLSDIFSDLPLAIIKLEEPIKVRNAGILMPITSLPSDFGIGDIGKEAHLFADFLSRARQSLWQLLPLNPTSKGAGYSPYSPYSSMAGNTMLISLENLCEQNLLITDELKQNRTYNRGKINYRKAESVKSILLARAWQVFSENKPEKLSHRFENFLKKEEHWLNDFALFELLKRTYDCAPWYQWPEEFRKRNEASLKIIAQENELFLLEVKWKQFIFFEQWHALKNYCARLDVKLFGDLPFYIAHDSADVWANQEIFCIDENGEMKGVAGVPPDGFSKDGQLWSMPVYCWDVLKNRGYDWWITRIKKNLELYDLLRLDHFRAFDKYWQVTVGKSTAIDGNWKTGPGNDLFNELKNHFPDMPFVAEDLGEITEEVYALRDQFNLPGMKVLQFAFGEGMDKSPHIPHNYMENFIVYSGTHDNNTTRGWYRKNLTRTDRKRLADYLNMRISERSVANEIITLAYRSVAKTVIIPMQDFLNLDEKSRLNDPAQNSTNWQWQMKVPVSERIEKEILKLTRQYNR